MGRSLDDAQDSFLSKADRVVRKHELEMTKMHADYLIVTVTKVESKAVLEAFQEATGREAEPVSIDDRIYFDLGEVKGAHVFMVRSEMGAGGLGASQQAVRKGIEALSPVGVIMVGIASAHPRQKQCPP